jgi:hypothetical protein
MRLSMRIEKWFRPEVVEARLRVMASDISYELAYYVWAQARDYCPVRSGFLRDSIQLISEADGSRHWVIATAPYAEPVEFGYTMRNGTRVGPRMYMRRALRDGANRYPDIVKDARVRQGFHRGAVMGVEFAA